MHLLYTSKLIALLYIIINVYDKLTFTTIAIVQNESWKPQTKIVRKNAHTRQKQLWRNSWEWPHEQTQTQK